MKNSTLARGLGGFSALVLLAACQDGLIPQKPPVVKEPSVGSAVIGQVDGKGKEQDVEAPQVFSAEEPGLWDGRPSFGGVWVAHPDASSPERVRITNTSTGATVAGALFRREREFPGPRIQISSNAAAALGILAGQPTELEVVALRREVVAPPPPVVDPAKISDEEVNKPAAKASEAAPAAAAATAAVAAEDATEEAALTPAEIRRQKREEAARLRAEEAQKRKEAREAARKEREEKRLAAKQARDEAAAAKKAAAAAAAAERAAAKQAAAEKTATKPQSRPASGDPIAAAAAAIGVAEGASASAAVEAPKPPKAPFLQIGTYKTAVEAEQIGDELRAAGLLPTIVERKVFNSTTWRIIVGPAATQADFDTMQATLNTLGFAGAKPVRR